jgi:restriction endonuclease S subunit
MRFNLGEIANINFGPYLKGTDNGQIKYLLASHFDYQAKPNLFENSYIDENDLNKNDLLQSGDVILAGKGQRTFAWAYEENMGDCVASSLFFVLKIDTTKVMSKFLAHYLNTEKVQHQLKLMAGGFTIPSIPKKELQQLNVFLPSLNEQQEFVNFSELIQEDIYLAETLLQKKKELKNTIINKMINNISNGNKYGQ